MAVIIGWTALAVVGVCFLIVIVGVCIDEGGLMAFGVIIGIIALITFGVCAMTEENTEHKRLMAMCLADGNKEYDCVAKLKNNSPTVVPVPVIIPYR